MHAMRLNNYCCVKVLRGDSTDQVREAQKLKPRLHHAGADVDHLGGHLVTDRARHELHRPSCSDADPLHVLQLRLSHLLVSNSPTHRRLARRKNASMPYQAR